MHCQPTQVSLADVSLTKKETQATTKSLIAKMPPIIRPTQPANVCLRADLIDDLAQSESSDDSDSESVDLSSVTDFSQKGPLTDA